MKNNNPFVTAIILAAGSGSRMGIEITKQRLSICEESVLKRSVKAFAQSELIDSIVVVVREDECSWAHKELLEIPKIYRIVSGGKNRAESAVKGFSNIDPKTEYVAIHDGARCLVTQKIIEDVVKSAFQYGAATAATGVTDTLKSADQNGFINRTIPRERIYSAQTPQVFSREIYSRALSPVDNTSAVTDDNMMIEMIGEKIAIVETGCENIKITRKADVDYAEFILERRRGMNEIRVGHGYDVHKLVPERKLILGGVEIPHTLGLLGHSDADVLTHAIMDALLGACALGDIGHHFPDSAEEYKNISSLILLRRVSELIEENGFEIINIDATLIAQKPKIASYIDLMKINYCNILGVNQGRINIKATTEEHLGFTGREEGISAHAVVSIKNKG